MTAAGRLCHAGRRCVAPRRRRRRTPARQTAPEPLSLQGFGMAGLMTFSAADSFDAVLDTDSGAIFGGGLRLVIPGGPYLEVGAWRFEQDGERAFVTSNGQVFPLGIPLTVHDDAARDHRRLALPRAARPRGSRRTSAAATRRCATRRRPSSPTTTTTSSDRFNGFHLTGGADFRLARWVAVGGDVTWTSVGDAIGESGASAVFEEDDLGGTSVRVRLILGR